MTLFDTLVELEENDEVHTGRLLVLMQAFEKRDGDVTIDGLTKLAKLDFLLRYPVLLERAITRRGFDPESVRLMNHERESVESKMVRYRYGPWDFRYRRFLNLMAAQGLCKLNFAGRTVEITLTDEGKAAGARLAASTQFQDIALRAKLLRKYFDKSGTWLKDFVYEAFPEVVNLRIGEEIN